MGGQSCKCNHCTKWFLSRYSMWQHIKDAHLPEFVAIYTNDAEKAAYRRGYARGLFGDSLERSQNFPNAYARGYWTGKNEDASNI